MYIFNATVTNDYTISIESNTYWSCKAEGSFKLSKYDGSGSDVINIIIPDDIVAANGVVTFSFGDERCKYPEVPIFFSNNCYIVTYPTYRLCNDKKTIFFFYEEARETFYVSVECFDGWRAESSSLNYITSDNDVMIIASGSDGELRIVPAHQCNEKNIIYVKLVKKNTYIPPSPPTPPSPQPPTISVTGVKLNENSVSLKPYENEKLIATILPENATNKNVIWTSTNEDIAIVNQNGLVTSKSTGDCVITVTTLDGGFTSNCIVTVSNSPTPAQTKDYLTFVPTEGGTFKFDSYTNDCLSYSIDYGQTWVQIESGVDSPKVPIGKKIMWKGNLNPSMSSSPYGIGHFSSTNKFNVEGNIMSLLYCDDFEDKTSIQGKKYVFHSLFSGCTNLVSAEKLSLVSTTLEYCCYEYMFYACSSLTNAPKLPATTLSTGCYSNMFRGCTILNKAPELNANSMKNNCYAYMFMNCINLTSSPTLPSKNLGNVYECYRQMFDGCINLKHVKCLATNLGDIDSNINTYKWLYMVSNNGTFEKTSSMADWPVSVDGIPEGWMVVNV